MLVVFLLGGGRKDLNLLRAKTPPGVDLIYSSAEGVFDSYLVSENPENFLQKLIICHKLRKDKLSLS